MVMPTPAGHLPVMLGRTIEILSPALKTGGTYVDCTLGLGGHAEAVLSACPRARLVGIDRDPDALAIAGARLAPFGDRVALYEAVYDELSEVLAEDKTPRVQAILADLGLSSMQIDRRERGFSYAHDAPLDMRMSQVAAGPSAADIVNTYAAPELARLLRVYGEERFADRIAHRIVAERDAEPFVSSARLVATIDAAIPAAAKSSGGHPAKRTFQALRIEVNGELSALAGLMPDALAALAPGGRFVVLAYHSLEDRLVKRAFAAATTDTAPRGLPVVPPEHRARFEALTRGAEKPSADEAQHNRRAASARLRAVQRREVAP